MTEGQALLQNLLITRAIMLTTILVAITSIVFSSITMAFERSHNVKSLRPFVNVIPTFTQNSISLSIENAGLGPMLIEKVTFISKDNPASEGKLLSDILPVEFRKGKQFVCSELYTLAVQNKLAVFELTFEKQEMELLSKLKEILGNYSLKVEYRDVYDHEYLKFSPITG
jgi:hypothetical protein